MLGKRLAVLGLSFAVLCGMNVFGSMAFEKAAAVYDGALLKNGSPYGCIQVKVAKASAKKGAAPTSKVTATVQLVDSKKKLSFKKGVATLDGAVTDMAAGGKTLKLKLGEDVLDGQLGDMEIIGGRNLAQSKDKADKSAAAAAAAAWAPGFTVAQKSDKGWNGYSVQLDKKGSKAKISGLTAGSKKKPGGVGTFFIRDGKCMVLAMYNKNAQTVFAVGGAKDGKGGVLLEGIDNAKAGKMAGSAGDTIVPAAGLPAGIHYGADGVPEKLKVKTNQKTGEVTVSFTAYQTVKGKEKKVTVKVSGMLVDGVTYANTVAGKTESVPLTVQAKDTPKEKVFDGEAKSNGGLLTPTQENPDPVNPDPVNPDPVNPDPVNPDPVNPDPVNPDPVNPDPVNPDPVNPDPVKPDPVNPDPVNPDPVKPDPVNPEPEPATVLPDWAIGTFDGTYWSDWYSADEEDTRTRCENGDFAVTTAEDGSVTISLTAIDKSWQDASLFLTADSVKVAGKLAFVSAHREPDHNDPYRGLVEDIPDSYAVDATVTFPSGRVLPIVFRVYRTGDGEVVWEIGADHGTPGGCFWFAYYPYVPSPAPLTDVAWANGDYYGTFVFWTPDNEGHSWLVNFMVNKGVLTGTIYGFNGASATIPECSLSAATYYDYRNMKKRDELTAVVPSFNVKGVEQSGWVVHVRANPNAEKFGVVEVVDGEGGYVTEGWQTLWSNTDPTITRPEFPEAGVVYDHYTEDTHEYCNTFTLHNDGSMEMKNKYTDETHWTNYKIAPMTVWAVFAGDEVYQLRAPCINEYQDGGFYSDYGSNTSNDFYVPVSGPVTAADIEKHN